MKYKVLLLILVLLMTEGSLGASSECMKWFMNSKIQAGPKCLMSCVTAKISMGSFTCRDQCAELCPEPSSTESLFSLGQLSWRAEKVCSQLFRASRTNDESDACRHFVWASLLTREFGIEFANQVLNAHEQDGREPEKNEQWI